MRLAMMSWGGKGERESRKNGGNWLKLFVCIIFQMLVVLAYALGWARIEKEAKGIS